MRDPKVLTAALLALMGTAQAQSEFDYSYNGTLLTWCSSPSGGGCGPGEDPNVPRADPWMGTLSFITSSSADGAYSCLVGCGPDHDGELIIGFNGTLWPRWFPRVPLGFPGDVFRPLTLTLLNGAVVSLIGTFSDDPSVQIYSTDGEALAFGRSTFGTEGTVRQIGTATLTAIPEPETWALLLAGLASIGGFTRRRSRHLGSLWSRAKSAQRCRADRRCE